MKKIFLDTNILVDVISDRKPFSKYAIEIFRLAESKQLELFTSSHSVATTHYLLKKYLDEKVLRNVITDILSLVTVVAVDSDVIKKSLRSSHKDFEDAIQMFCAGSVSGIYCIVSRNTKHFRASAVKCLNPDEFLTSE